SIVGDPVNVAARLESLTEELGVPILVSEATARAAQGFRFVDLGLHDLRGRSAATRVFALHDAGTTPDDAEFATFERLHRAVLDATRGSPEQAEAIAVASANPHGARYARFYAR
ncbi:MAG TPA: adenylate/guanylate cyclase domain-containing protein, partial [Beijerinckiaceae bacterium]|nr:adenylate/guanylate cyclase domain-containing protein [Beijerinckiaceae bacterium]